MKFASLFLSCAVLGSSAYANAGSYTMKTYGDNFIKPTQAESDIDRIEALAIDVGSGKKVGEGSTKDSYVVENESTGNGSKDSLGWISGLGKINEQYHKDVQALTARQRAGTSYAKISSADNIEGLIVSGKFKAPTNYASTAIARQSNSIYRHAYDAMIDSLAVR